MFTGSTWPFVDWTLLLSIYTHFDKLHTVSVGWQHADEVTELYTKYSSDSDELREAKAELLEARDSGDFKVISHPIKMSQLKLTEMSWLVSRH